MYQNPEYEIPYKKVTVKQTGTGVPIYTELYIPDLKAPKGRNEMSIVARRALDLMNELHPTALDMCNMSGLTDRIFEEIADKANELYTQIQTTMRKHLPKNQTWEERAQALESIAQEADRQRFELMHELVEVTSQAALHSMSLSELEAWQLP